MNEYEEISREFTEYLDKVYEDKSQKEARKIAIQGIINGNTDEKIVELSGLSLSEVKELREKVVFVGASLIFNWLKPKD